MKKVISLLLAAVLCLGLVACGSKTLGEEVSGGMTDEHIALVVELMEEYVEHDYYKELVERTECKGVKSAMYYVAEGAAEGVDLHLLLIELDADDEIVGWDRLLVVDLDNHDAFNATMLNMNDYTGEMDTHEDLLKMAFGGFHSWLMFKDAQCIMTELEVRTPATKDQIAAINAELNG